MHASKPVSYTHLDVYKRQKLSFEPLPRPILTSAALVQTKAPLHEYVSAPRALLDDPP